MVGGGDAAELGAELRALSRELRLGRSSGAPVMPCVGDLLAAGRGDLARAITAGGGYHAVAAGAGLASRRHPRRYELRF